MPGARPTTQQHRVPVPRQMTQGALRAAEAARAGMGTTAEEPSSLGDEKIAWPTGLLGVEQSSAAQATPEQWASEEDPMAV